MTMEPRAVVAPRPSLAVEPGGLASETAGQDAGSLRPPAGFVKALRSESGATIVELSVAMFITALLSTVMVTWLFAGFGSDASHTSYDAALNDLREVTDQMSREVRSADYLTAASDSSMTFWLDGNRNGTIDTGETISWYIEGNTVIRAVVIDDDLSTETVMATHISNDASSFSYDAVSPVDIGRVTIDLVALAQTRAGRDSLEHSTIIYLRNV